MPILAQVVGVPRRCDFGKGGTSTPSLHPRVCGFVDEIVYLTGQRFDGGLLDR